MFESIASKVLGFIAREAVPFILSMLVRNGLKRVEKKIDKLNNDD